MPMERLTLTPQHSEIVINNGSPDGAVDLFSYGPDAESSAQSLGSLYVVGWRQADTNTMGYIVSLIAAMARREYYAQPNATPREAFTRILHRINEVVDEFFKSSGVNLAVGVFAIAGSSIMVSKLDKFKILLARDGEVVDILNNIGLFTKEHLEKRQFSSIISGSVQPGDKLLAYYPSRQITSRERLIKSMLLKEETPGVIAKLQDIGRTHPEFAVSFLCIDMLQTSEAAIEEQTGIPDSEPVMPAPTNLAPTLAWQPRQAAPPVITEEIPRIISTEFSLGSREHKAIRWIKSLKFVRLDNRGKALALGLAAIIIAGGTLAARTYWLVSPQEQNARKLTSDISATIHDAQSKTKTDPEAARQLLLQSLAKINSSSELKSDQRGAELAASIMSQIDTLDNAQPGTPSVMAQLDPQTDKIVLATWATSSSSLWAVTKSADSGFAVVSIADSSISRRVSISEKRPDILLGYQDGAIVISNESKNIVRIKNNVNASYKVPTEDTILDAAVFGQNIYILTDKGILKVTDIDGKKPATTAWLTDASQFAPNGQRILIDGNVYVMGSDGVLTTYYKGKKIGSATTPLRPSGSWQLVPAVNALAIANADRARVYVFNKTSGNLERTIKLDSQQAPSTMAGGPDNTVIFVSPDNRIWKLQ